MLLSRIVFLTSPSATKTQILGRLGCAEQQVEGVLKNRDTPHPIERAGEPEEIARMIAFLASRDAKHITGMNTPVGGGPLYTPPSLTCPDDYD